MRTTINNGACVIRAVTLGRPEPKITEKSASDNNTKQSSTAEYVFNESWSFEGLASLQCKLMRVIVFEKLEKSKLRPYVGPDKLGSFYI